jgi:hypothetical protein
MVSSLYSAFAGHSRPRWLSDPFNDRAAITSKLLQPILEKGDCLDGYQCIFRDLTRIVEQSYWKFPVKVEE